MDTITTTNKNHRARWAAVGAALAVSLGAGGIGISHAVVESPTPMPIYTAITPCRLIDTRADADYHVGAHNTLANDQTITVAGWGDVDGDCNLSGASSALELNVTAVGPSQATVLTVYPAGETKPNASNLNPTPGQPPTPNSVTATLNGAGEFSIWNAFGTVDVVVDVVGVYEDHQHTGEDIVDGSLTGDDIADESLTGDDIDDGTLTGDDIKNHSVSNLVTSNEAGVTFAEYIGESEAKVPGNPFAPPSMGSVKLAAPSQGVVVVTSTATVRFASGSTSPDVFCGLKTADEAAYGGPQYVAQDRDNTLNWETMTLHRTIQVDAGTTEFQLVCGALAGDQTVRDMRLTAMFFPTSYDPLIYIPSPIACPPLCIISP